MTPEEQEQLQADIEADQIYYRSLATGYIVAVPVGILILVIYMVFSGK